MECVNHNSQEKLEIHHSFPDSQFWKSIRAVSTMIIITSLIGQLRQQKFFVFVFLLQLHLVVLNFQSNVMVMYFGYVRTLLCLLRPKFLWFWLRRKSAFKKRKTSF